MDAKEAKRIIEQFRGTELLPDETNPNAAIKQIPLNAMVRELIEAEGYLACLEGPEVKALVGAVTEAVVAIRDAAFMGLPISDGVFLAVKPLEDSLALYKESIKNSGEEVG